MIEIPFTDCGIPTDTSVCQEHNVGECATCIKDEGACDWGGCHDAADVRVRCISVPNGRVLEVRPLCVRHAIAFVERVDGGKYEYEILRLWQTGYTGL